MLSADAFQALINEASEAKIDESDSTQSDSARGEEEQAAASADDESELIPAPWMEQLGEKFNNIENCYVMIEQSSARTKRKYSCKARVKSARRKKSDVVQSDLSIVSKRMSDDLKALQECSCVDPDDSEVQVDVMSKHTSYYQETLILQHKQFIGDHIRRALETHQNLSDASDSEHLQFNVAKLFSSSMPLCRALCLKCFRAYYGISRSLLYEVLKKAKSGTSVFEDGRSGSNLDRSKTAAEKHQIMTTWVLNYAERSGEHCPAKAKRIYLAEYHWKNVWRRCMDEIKVFGVHCEYENFMVVRQNHFKHIKSHKWKSHAKCTECNQLEIECKTAKQAKDRAMLLLWELRLDQHHKWQEAEREKKPVLLASLLCYSVTVLQRVHQLHALDATKSAMFIEIDGMDQRKTILPNPSTLDHSLDMVEPMKTHLTGGLQMCGGNVTRYFAYLYHDRWPNGSDVTISILLDILARSNQEDLKAETLYMYTDNAWGSNKNQYVQGFLNMLVHEGIFKTVYACFLPKGHTHCKVDAMFGILTEPLLVHDIMTIKDIGKVVTDAYRPTGASFEPVYLEVMGSFSSLLANYLAPTITGISKPRFFKIQKSADGVVRHKWRLQLQEFHVDRPYPSYAPFEDDDDNAPEFVFCPEHPDSWMPWQGEGYAIFPDEVPKIFSQPEDYPVFDLPTKPTDCATLRVTLRKHMNEEQKIWWDTTLNTFEDEDLRQCQDCTDFRVIMTLNGARKADDPAKKTLKAALYKAARSGMQEHLAEMSRTVALEPDHNVRWQHNLFGVPKLTARWAWLNGKVFEISRENDAAALRNRMTEEQKELLARCDQKENEGRGDEYYVGSAFANPGRAPQAQAGWTFDVGDVVVYREELGYMIDGMQVPFSVGQILAYTTAPSDEAGGAEVVNELEIHRFENAANNRLPKAVYFRDYWNAALNHSKPRDLILLSNKRKATKGYEMQVRKICATNAITWGASETVLNKGGTLTTEALKAIHLNEDTDWQYPKPYPKSWKDVP